jgi:hypothetical protein
MAIKKAPRTSRPYSQARDPRQRYRVHDGTKDKTTLVVDGTPAENLTWDEAQKVKSYAAAMMKERTASVAPTHLVEEAMVVTPEPAPLVDGGTVVGATFGNLIPTGLGNLLPISGDAGLGSVTTPESPPHADPVLEAQRQAALAAAAGAAAAANARHPVAAAKKAAAVVPPADISLDALDDDQLTGSLDDLLGGDDAADLEVAGAQAAEDRKAYEAGGKALYDSMKDPADPAWETLSEKEQADWSFQAANPVTPPGPDPVLDEQRRAESEAK